MSDDPRAELTRIREGADETPVDEACAPTAGQLWHRMLTEAPARRAARLQTVLVNMEAVASCFQMDHEREIEHLRQRLVDAEFVMRVMRGFAMFPNDLCDVLTWRTDGEYAPITFLVDCSDEFAWGGSDCEPLTDGADLDALEAALAEVAAVEPRYPGYGTTLWVARKRGTRPQGATYPSSAPGVWPLFDACGPKREVGSGNPKPAPTDRLPCRWFRWVGQSFLHCDGCGQPAWEHEGSRELKEDAPMFGGGDDVWVGRPWKPGEADGIRRKWDPDYEPASSQVEVPVGAEEGEKE